MSKCTNLRLQKVIPRRPYTDFTKVILKPGLGSSLLLSESLSAESEVSSLLTGLSSLSSASVGSSSLVDFTGSGSSVWLSTGGAGSESGSGSGCGWEQKEEVLKRKIDFCLSTNNLWDKMPSYIYGSRVISQIFTDHKLFGHVQDWHLFDSL